MTTPSAPAPEVIDYKLTARRFVALLATIRDAESSNASEEEALEGALHSFASRIISAERRRVLDEVENALLTPEMNGSMAVNIRLTLRLLRSTKEEGENNAN